MASMLLTILSMVDCCFCCCVVAPVLAGAAVELGADIVEGMLSDCWGVVEIVKF